ncbi:hypothetical protein [Streptomyces sp. TRM49041]|uniref:hypothetical protein n=1 Tax=Streptomyces sp. TRM49041 TaxID=2603216 RepID=UPI0011EBD94C|nr:hypothetical protein [Streptomyces sp. TRM49041]
MWRNSSSVSPCSLAATELMPESVSYAYGIKSRNSRSFASSMASLVPTGARALSIPVRRAAAQVLRLLLRLPLGELLPGSGRPANLLSHRAVRPSGTTAGLELTSTLAVIG